MKEGREERALTDTVSSCAGRETSQGCKQGYRQEGGKGKPNMCVVAHGLSNQLGSLHEG